MVYAGILAHGTALSAAETARMIPQLSAGTIRQAMRFAADGRRLAEASRAVLEYMHRHPIAVAAREDRRADGTAHYCRAQIRVLLCRTVVELSACCRADVAP